MPLEEQDDLDDLFIAETIGRLRRAYMLATKGAPIGFWVESGDAGSDLTLAEAFKLLWLALNLSPKLDTRFSSYMLLAATLLELLLQQHLMIEDSTTQGWTDSPIIVVVHQCAAPKCIPVTCFVVYPTERCGNNGPASPREW